MRLITLILAFLLVAPFEALAAGAGTVTYKEGDVQIIRDGSTQALALKDSVKANDVIVTGEDGRVRLKMVDDSVLYLGTRSRIVIDRYETDKQGLTSGVFSMLWGKARFLVSKLKRATSDFSVHTKTATIGVRGTEFGIIVPPTPSAGGNPPYTDVMLFEGSIAGRNLQGGEVLIQPKQIVRFIPGQPPQVRQITPEDLQRLGIGALANGLVVPTPMLSTPKGTVTSPNDPNVQVPVFQPPAVQPPVVQPPNPVIKQPPPPPQPNRGVIGY
jgi:hypothetical protein